MSFRTSWRSWKCLNLPPPSVCTELIFEYSSGTCSVLRAYRWLSLRRSIGVIFETLKMPCMTTRILLYPQWQNPTENHMSFNKIHPLKYAPLSAVLFLFLLPFSRSLGIHMKVTLWHVGAHRSSQVWTGSFRAQRTADLSTVLED